MRGRLPQKLVREIALLPEDLSDNEYRRRVKAIVRRLIPFSQAELAENGPFDVFDLEIEALALEVIQEG